MRVNEYGVIFRFSVGYDISAETELSLVFTKPDGTVMPAKVTPDVSVGVTPVVTTLGTFAANEYVNYTFVSGDIDQAGVWTAQLTYDEGATIRLISDKAQFTVDD